jgi:hypothetical protein
MRVHVLDENRTLVGSIGGTLASLEFTRKWQGTDTAKLVINRRRMHAASITNGRFLYLPDEGHRLFFVEQILTTEAAGRDKDLLAVHCRGLEGPVGEERLVIPGAAGWDVQTNVAAETAMKHYVDGHAGPTAAAARRFPGHAIAADQARGSLVDVAARHQALATILKQIGLVASMGWEYTFDPVAKTYAFDVIPGVDRTASVFMDIDFGTLEHYEELFSWLDSKTMILVGGQGEGADRELVTRHADGVEKTGFARREAFVDARDVEQGMTSVLADRGDAALAELRAERRYDAEVHAFGSFRYREHWDLGDLVLLRNAEAGLATPVRVAAVKTMISGPTASPERTAELGRPMPTLKERVSPGVTSVSARDTVDLPLKARALKTVGGYTIAETAGDLLVADALLADILRRTAAGNVTLKGFGRLRFVPLESNFIEAFTTGAAVATISTATIAALPTHAKAVLIQLVCHSSVASPSNALVARHFSSGLEAGRAYAGAAANYRGAAQTIVELGGNRQIKISVEWGAGTITYSVRVKGYFTDDNG